MSCSGHEVICDCDDDEDEKEYPLGKEILDVLDLVSNTATDLRAGLVK